MISNEEGNKEYRIERLSAQRLKDLETLYAAVYGAAPAPDYFRKKYDTAYTGAAYVGWLSYNRENIAVAYYGVVPTFVQYNGETILAAQSVDTMTHPQYRYKGMFAELSKDCFDLCRKSGIRFIFGFPNQNFYKAAMNKWGWETIETMECFVIPVRTLPLQRLSERIARLKGFYRKYSRRVLDKYALPLAGLPNSAAGDGRSGISEGVGTASDEISGAGNGFGGVLRNEAYFRYKKYSDTVVIRAGQAKAWVRINNGLVIGDLQLDGQDLGETIRIMKQIAARLGAGNLFFHSSPGTRLHGLFKARYEAIASFPVIIQDLGAGLAYEKIKFTFADIDIF